MMRPDGTECHSLPKAAANITTSLPKVCVALKVVFKIVGLVEG